MFRQTNNILVGLIVLGVFIALIKIYTPLLYTFFVILKALLRYILKIFATKDSMKKDLLSIYAIVVLYLCIFHVPWRGGTVEHPTAFFLEYSSIWEAPQDIARIDFGIILMELFAVTVVAGVLYYLLSSSKKQ